MTTHAGQIGTVVRHNSLKAQHFRPRIAAALISGLPNSAGFDALFLGKLHIVDNNSWNALGGPLILSGRLIMSMSGEIGGEGASLTWTRGVTGAAPNLVVCPMVSAAAGMEMTAAQEMYRLAYEWAQAMMRPSTYEIARRACWN